MRRAHKRGHRGGPRRVVPWAVTAILVTVATAGVAGCDRLDVFQRELRGVGAFVLDGAFVTWDAARRAYARVDLSRPPGEPHPVSWHRVTATPGIARTTPAGDALLVLSPEDRSLTVLPAAEDRETVTYELGQPFDELSVADDGAYAVAYASAEGAAGAGTIAVSHNLLSLLVLDSPPGDDNPVARSISSYGGARLGVDLSPDFLVDATTHRIAVIRSEGHVALVDLTDPRGDAIAVPLVVPGDPTDLRTRKARFAVRGDGRGGLWIFLTADGGGDVIALELSGATELDGAPAAGLTATLNQHAVGGWVADALPVRDSTGRLHVVALSANARLLKMIDAETGESVSFSLDVGFNVLTLFNVPDEEGVEHPHVLLSAAGVNRFAVLAIDEVAERGVKALRQRALRENYQSIVPIPGRPRFVAFASSGHELALVWLAHEAAEETVAFAGVRNGYAFAADGSALHLLVGSESVGGAGLGDFLVTIDLSSGQLAERALDPVARSLQVLPGGAGRLLVVHDSPVGMLSLLSPDAKRGERIMGFLLEGVLNE